MQRCDTDMMRCTHVKKKQDTYGAQKKLIITYEGKNVSAYLQRQRQQNSNCSAKNKFIKYCKQTFKKKNANNHLTLSTFLTSKVMGK